MLQSRCVFLAGRSFKIITNLSDIFSPSHLVLARPSQLFVTLRSLSNKMSYLDIHTLLCDEERIPCTFIHDSVKLGHLDPSAEEKDIAADTRVDMPIWLGEELAKRNIVRINAPKHFGTKMRDEMRAGATSINLRDFSFYFFDVGLTLSRLSGDSDLRRRLRDAFVGDRYRNLTARSLTLGTGDDGACDYSQTLTSTELVIFKEGLRSLNNLHQWRSAESTLLRRAPVLGRRDKSTRNGTGTAAEGPNKRR